MKQINLLLVSLFFMGLLYSCSGGHKDEAAMMTDAISPTAEAATSQEMKKTDIQNTAVNDENQTENIKIERKLIKEGKVEFETEDLAVTRKTILSAAEMFEGYISSDQENKWSGRINNTIVVRVPALDFDKFMAEALKGVQHFDNKEIDTKDVTEEFLDIEARLKTKKELEARYLELLKKANSVSEILAVERQVGELRSEIESIEGRLRYLKNKIGFSTLTITFYEVIPGETSFGRKFKDGFSNGWQNLVWFFVALTNIWPFIIILIIIIVLIVKRRRKKQSQK